MTFSKGQIVKVNLNHGWTAHGRVTSVDETGDGEAMFVLAGTIVKSPIVPEMVVDAFWQDGTGRYGV